MNLYRTVSTLRGVAVLSILAFLALGLIWWQGELTRIEEETHAAYASMYSE